ncbi:hypothetical protein PLICRDRAFT_27484 [Plicaturopsis crispa FD-325 SS-3]|nr:hypothetical protein PLICRDRAFT_27484 [Plicaturopsis crispa FD-325 SS-3]
MSSTAGAFVRADWISCGKSWVDVPPTVKHNAKLAFAIPEDLCSHLLPSKDISVHAMLEFTLPRQDSTSEKALPGCSTLQRFFSKDKPDIMSPIMLSKLRWLPTSTVHLTRHLVKHARQAWLDGHTSVKYTHLDDTVSTSFPLWLVSRDILVRGARP